jgi:hypothetical protein
MKKVKTTILWSAATLALITASFISQARVTEEIIPATGCRYTGVSSDYCIYGNYAITSCSNNSEMTTCGFNAPPTEQIVAP